jgi:hypothetical protein
LGKNLNASFVTIASQNSNTKDEVIEYKERFNEKNFKDTFLFDYPELGDLFKELKECIPKDKLDEMSYSIKIFVSQIMHYLMVISITILYELGKYPFYKYLQKFQASYDKIYN